MKKHITASLLLFLCVAATSYKPIVVRHDVPFENYLADPAEYPSLFGFYRSVAGSPVCLANVINSRWAITAAHCTRNANFEEQVNRKGFPVRVGDTDVLIDKLVTHPSWQGRPGFRARDVALVRFKEPISTPPALLYSEPAKVGTIVDLVGWGGTGHGTTGFTEHDGVFRLAQNRIDDVNDRWVIWDFDSPLSTPEKSLPLEGVSGPGDSGGPAYIIIDGKRYIVGISSMQLSRNMPEGTYGVTEYYTRVDTILDWIKSTIDTQTETP